MGPPGELSRPTGYAKPRPRSSIVSLKASQILLVAALLGSPILAEASTPTRTSSRSATVTPLPPYYDSPAVDYQVDRLAAGPIASSVTSIDRDHLLPLSLFWNPVDRNADGNTTAAIEAPASVTTRRAFLDGTPETLRNASYSLALDSFTRSTFHTFSSGGTYNNLAGAYGLYLGGKAALFDQTSVSSASALTSPTLSLHSCMLSTEAYLPPHEENSKGFVACLVDVAASTDLSLAEHFAYRSSQVPSQFSTVAPTPLPLGKGTGQYQIVKFELYKWSMSLPYRRRMLRQKLQNDVALANQQTATAPSARFLASTGASIRGSGSGSVQEDAQRIESYLFASYEQELSKAGVGDGSKSGSARGRALLAPSHGWDPAKARALMFERRMGMGISGGGSYETTRQLQAHSGGSLHDRFADLSLWIRLQSPSSISATPSSTTTPVMVLPTKSAAPYATSTPRSQVIKLYQGTRQARSVLACYIASKITAAFRVASEGVLRAYSAEPLVGSSAGGEVIVIKGKGFQGGGDAADSGGIAVKALIGGNYCVETTVIDDGTLHCIIPPGDGVGLTVSVSRGYRRASIEKLFSYNPPTPRDVPYTKIQLWPSEIEPSDALAAKLAARIEAELTMIGRITDETLTALRAVPQVKAGLAMANESVISASLTDASSTLANLVEAVVSAGGTVSTNGSSTSSSSPSTSTTTSPTSSASSTVTSTVPVALTVSTTPTITTAYRIQLLSKALMLSQQFNDATLLSAALRASLPSDPFDPTRNVGPNDLDSKAHISIYGSNLLSASDSQTSKTGPLMCRWINSDATLFQTLTSSAEAGKDVGYWNLPSAAADEVKDIVSTIAGSAASSSFATCQAPVSKSGLISLEVSTQPESMSSKDMWNTGTELKITSLLFTPSSSSPEVTRLVRIETDANNQVSLSSAVKAGSDPTISLFTYNSSLANYTLPLATVAAQVKPDPEFATLKPFEAAVPDDNYEKAAMPHVTILYLQGLQLGQDFNTTGVYGDMLPSDAQMLLSNLLSSVDEKDGVAAANLAKALKAALVVNGNSNSTASGSDSRPTAPVGAPWNPWDPFSSPAVSQAMLRHHAAVQSLQHSIALELTKVNKSLLFAIDVYNDDPSLLRYTRVHVESVFWPDCRQLYRMAREDNDKEAMALIGPCAAAELVFYSRLNGNSTPVEAADDVARVMQASSFDPFSTANSGIGSGVGAGTRADLQKYAELKFPKAAANNEPMAFKPQENYFQWLAMETNQEATILMAGVLLRHHTKRAARAGRPVVGITGPYPYDRVMTELGGLGSTHTRATPSLKRTMGTRVGANDLILEPLPFRVVPSHRILTGVAAAAAEAHWTATGESPSSLFESLIGEKAAELIRKDPLAAAMMHVPFISTGNGAGGRRNINPSNRMRFPTVLKLTPPRGSSAKALAAFLTAYQGILLQKGLLSLSLVTKAPTKTAVTTSSSSTSIGTTSTSTAITSNSSTTAVSSGSSSAKTVDINSLATKKIVDALQLTPTERYFKRQLANATLLDFVVHPTFLPTDAEVGSFTCVIVGMGDAFFSSPWPPASTGLFRYTLQEPSSQVKKAAAEDAAKADAASASTTKYADRSATPTNETTPDSPESLGRKRGWTADAQLSQFALDAFAGFLSSYLDIALDNAYETLSTPEAALKYPDLFFPLWLTYGLSVPRVVYTPGSVPLKIVLMRPWAYKKEDSYAEIAEQLDISGKGVQWLKQNKVSFYAPNFADSLFSRNLTSSDLIATAPKLSIPTRTFVVLASPKRVAAIMDGAKMAGLLDSEPSSTYSAILGAETGDIKIEGYGYLFLGLEALRVYLLRQTFPWDIPYALTTSYSSKSLLYDIPSNDYASVNDPFMVSTGDVSSARTKALATATLTGQVVDSVMAFAYPLDIWTKKKRLHSMPRAQLRLPPDSNTGHLVAPLVPWSGKDVPLFNLIIRNSSGSPAVWSRASYLRPTTPYGHGGFYSEDSLARRVLAALQLIGGVALRDDADTVKARELVESSANDPVVDLWELEYWRPPLWLKTAVVQSVAKKMNLTTTSSTSTTSSTDGEPATLTDSNDLDVSSSSSTTASTLSTGKIITLGDLASQMTDSQLAGELDRMLDVVGGQIDTTATFSGSKVLTFDGLSEDLRLVESASSFRNKLPNGMPLRTETTTTTTTTTSASSSSSSTSTSTSTTTSLQAVFQVPSAVVFGIFLPVQEDAYSSISSYPGIDGGVEPGLISVIEATISDLNKDPRLNPNTFIYAAIIPVPIRYRRFGFTKAGAPRLIKDRAIAADLAYLGYKEGTFPDFLNDPDMSIDVYVEALQKLGNLVFSATSGKLSRNAITALVGGDETWRLYSLLAALHDTRAVLALSTKGTSISEVSDGGSPLPVFAFGSVSSVLAESDSIVTRTLVSGEQPKSVTVKTNRLLRIIASESSSSKAVLDLIRRYSWTRFGTITVLDDGQAGLEESLLAEGAHLGINASMILRVKVNATVYKLTASDQPTITQYHRSTGPGTLAALFEPLKSQNIIFIASSPRFQCALLRGVAAAGLDSGMRTFVGIGSFLTDDDVCAPAGPGILDTIVSEAERHQIEDLIEGTIGAAVPAQLANAIYNQSSRVKTTTTIVDDSDPNLVIGHNFTEKSSWTLRNYQQDRFDTRLVDQAFLKRVIQQAGEHYLRTPSLEEWRSKQILMHSDDLALIDNAVKKHAQVLGIASVIEDLRAESIATAASNALWSLKATEIVREGPAAYDNARLKLSPHAAGVRDAIYAAAVGMHLSHASGTIAGVGYTKADAMIKVLRKNYIDTSLAAGGGLTVQSLAQYVSSDAQGAGNLLAFADELNNDLTTATYAIVNRRRLSDSDVPENVTEVNRTITLSQYLEEQAASSWSQRRLLDEPPRPPVATTSHSVSIEAGSNTSITLFSGRRTRYLATTRTRYAWGEGPFLPDRTTSQFVIAGTYTGVSELAVGLCQAGTEKNQVTFECEQCPLNTYNPKDGGRCTSCPGIGDYTTFTAGQVGAKGVEMCQCPSGFFLPFTKSTETFTVFPCEPCRYSMSCAGSATGLKIDTIPNEKGFWRGSNDTTYFDACVGVGVTGCGISSLVQPRMLTAHSTDPQLTTAEQTTGKVNGTTVIFLNGTECLEGYEGVLCATCAKGWGKSNDGISCVHCATSGPLAMVPWVIGALIFVGVLVYLSCNNAILPYSGTSSQISKRRSANIKVLLSFLQMMIAVHLLRSATTADDVTVGAIFSANSFPGVFATAGLTFAPWECALDSSSLPIVFQLFWLYVSLPLISFFILALAFPYLTRCCCRLGGKGKPAPSKATNEDGSLITSRDSARSSRPPSRRASLVGQEAQPKSARHSSLAVASGRSMGGGAASAAPHSHAVTAAVATLAGVKTWLFGRVFKEIIGIKSLSFTPIYVDPHSGGSGGDGGGEGSGDGGVPDEASQEEKADFAKHVNSTRRGTLLLPPEAATSGAAGEFNYATRTSIKDWSLNVLFSVIFIVYPMVVMRSLEVLNCYTLPSGYGSYLLSDFTVACHPTWAEGLGSYLSAFSIFTYGSTVNSENSIVSSTGIESTFQILATPSPIATPSPSRTPLPIASAAASSSSSSSTTAALSAVVSSAGAAAQKFSSSLFSNDGPVADQQYLYGSLGIIVLLFCIVFLPFFLLFYLLSKRDHLWLARSPVIIHPDRAQEIAVLAQKAVFDSQKWKGIVLECLSSTAGGGMLDGLLQKRMTRVMTALEAARKLLVIAKAWRVRLSRAKRSAAAVKVLLNRLPKRRNFHDLADNGLTSDNAQQHQLTSIEHDLRAAVEEAEKTMVILHEAAEEGSDGDHEPSKKDKAGKKKKKKTGVVSPGSGGADPEDLEKRVGKSARRLLNLLDDNDDTATGATTSGDDEEAMPSAPLTEKDTAFSLRIGPSAAAKASSSSSTLTAANPLVKKRDDAGTTPRGRKADDSSKVADGKAAKSGKSKTRGKSRERKSRSANRKSKSREKQEVPEEPVPAVEDAVALVPEPPHQPSIDQLQAEENAWIEYVLATDPRAKQARDTLDYASYSLHNHHHHHHGRSKASASAESANTWSADDSQLIALFDGSFRYKVFVRQVIFLQRSVRAFLSKKKKAEAAIAAAALENARKASQAARAPTTIAQMYALDKARRKAMREQIAAAVRTGNKRATMGDATQSQVAAQVTRGLIFDRGIATAYAVRVPEWYDPSRATTLPPPAEGEEVDEEANKATIAAAAALRKTILMLRNGGIAADKGAGGSSTTSPGEGSSNFGNSLGGSPRLSKIILDFLLCRPRGDIARKTVRTPQGRKFISFNLLQLRRLLDMLPVGPHPAAIPRFFDKDAEARKKKRQEEAKQKEAKILAFVAKQRAVFEKVFQHRSPLIEKHLSAEEKALLAADLEELEKSEKDKDSSGSSSTSNSNSAAKPTGKRKKGAPKKSLAESCFDQLMIYRRQVDIIDRYLQEAGTAMSPKEKQQLASSPPCPEPSFLVKSLSELDSSAKGSSFDVSAEAARRAVAVQVTMQLYAGSTYGSHKERWGLLWGKGSGATDSDDEDEDGDDDDDGGLGDTDSKSFPLPKGVFDPIAALEPRVIADAIGSISSEPWVCEMAGRAGLKQLIFDECAILITENAQTATEAFAFVVKTRLPAVIRAQRALGGLYTDFTPGYQYFFSWDLLRKAFLMTIAVFLSAQSDEDSGYVQLGTAMVMIGLLVVLAWWASPYSVIYTGVNPADPLFVYQSREDRFLRSGRMLEATIPRPSDAAGQQGVLHHRPVPPMRAGEDEETWRTRLLRRSRLVELSEVVLINQDDADIATNRRVAGIGRENKGGRIRYTYRDWRDPCDGTLAIRRSTMPFYGLPCPEQTPEVVALNARQGHSRPRLYRWTDLCAFVRGDFLTTFRALPELVSTPGLDRWSLSALLVVIILRTITVELQNELRDRLFDITPLATSSASKSHFYDDPDVWQLVQAGSKFSRPGSTGADVERFFSSVLPWIANVIIWLTIVTFIVVIGSDIIVELILRRRECSAAREFLRTAKAAARAATAMPLAVPPLRLLMARPRLFRQRL
jgi:IPT/TIG domain